MNIQMIHGSLIQRLGALEQGCFERLYHGILLLRVLLTALFLAQLGCAICDYVWVSDQVLMIEDALARTRGEFARKSTAEIENNKAQREGEPFREGATSGAATLEVINSIALAQGINLDEVQSGVTCDAEDPMSPRQIQITFRSSFSQLRDFNHSLNDVASTLVTKSLLIERNSSLDSSATITAKICISVVTKTS